MLIDWRDPAVRQVFKLMIPVTLGLGLINVNALIDTLFASRLIDPDLAPTAIQKAFLVYMLPQGMFSVAIATVLFPTLSRLASRGDMRGFGDTVSLGLRQIAFLLAPTAVVGAVLAEPIMRILYQRGACSPEQTPVVAAALAAFSAGLVFNGAMLMLNRGFFSLQDNWPPTAVALGQPRPERRPRLRLLPLRDLGHPARDRRLEHRRDRRAARAHARPARADRRAAITFSLLEDHRRLRSRRRGLLRRLAAARRPLGRSFPAQVVSLGAALLARDHGVPRNLPRASGARDPGATLLRGRFARS